MFEDCLKLTGYFDERQRSTGDRFLADVLLDLFGRHRIATSIVLRGIGGFGPHRILRSDRTLSLSEDPPIAVTAVDSNPAIGALLASVRAIPKRGLFTLERAHMRSGAALSTPADFGESVKLTVYVGRKQRVNGVPAQFAVCELMHRRGLAGTTVLLGVDGTAHGNRARAKFFDNNIDVPMMIISIGASERVAAVMPELVAMLHDPLITVERVRICKRDGALLHRPHSAAHVADHGSLQKLMVYTSEAARSDGEPIHRALVRRLRAAGSASGATVLRGIWGFHGNHRPHGDRLLALSRRVPVVTIIIDTPQRIADTFGIVDDVTAEQGLVTTEMVPALLPADGADASHHS